MALTMTPQTELDAVNVMLMSIGQAPVSTVTDTGIKDVEIARQILHNTSREVQTKGWTFNTDYAYSISPTVDDRILVPSNCLSIDPVNSGEDFVQRWDSDEEAMCMYDLHEQTFDRDTALEVDIVWFYEYEHLPQSARNYIGIKAARIFQAGAVASDVLFRFDQHHEQEALVTFMHEHSRVADRNILTGSPDFTAQIFQRRRNPRF
jgi:hypothetical protein